MNSLPMQVSGAGRNRDILFVFRRTNCDGNDNAGVDVVFVAVFCSTGSKPKAGQ